MRPVQENCLGNTDIDSLPLVGLVAVGMDPNSVSSIDPLMTVNACLGFLYGSMCLYRSDTYMSHSQSFKVVRGCRYSVLPSFPLLTTGRPALLSEDIPRLLSLLPPLSKTPQVHLLLSWCLLLRRDIYRSSPARPSQNI